MDIDEAARWISAELRKEGVAVGDDVVLRILNRETAFLAMVGLARAGDENGPQAGHIWREPCWVVEPNAQTGADWEVEGEREEVQ